MSPLRHDPPRIWVFGIDRVVCEQCGETVKLKEDPSIDRFFGLVLANKKQKHTALESFGMRRCTVSMTGTDGRRHSIETDALSLFDAAYNAQQQWAKLSWFDRNALVEVRRAKRLLARATRPH
jgi:hypothetical protein